MNTLGAPLVDLTLRTEFSEWQACNLGYTLRRHAYSVVQIDQFFGVGSLLWPTLVRHEGGLFLHEGFSASSFDKWRAGTTNLTDVERVMNHRHMRDMLKSFDTAPRALLLSAAHLIQQSWKGRLTQLCPEIPAAVDVCETDYDVEVTLYVIRT